MRSGLQQTVLLQFLTQGIAVDTEIFGRQRLIAAGIGQYDLKHGFLRAGDHHVVYIMRSRAVEILKIHFQAIAYALFYIVLAHAASRLGRGDDDLRDVS